MPGYTLKVKSKSGQSLLDGLGADSTVEELTQKILELTNVPIANQNVLNGFPPKKIDLGTPASTLKDIGVVNGDTLIVEDKAGANPSAAAATKADEEFAQSLAAAEESEFNGILMKKVVPADNSCLFTSIGGSSCSTLNWRCP